MAPVFLPAGCGAPGIASPWHLARIPRTHPTPRSQASPDSTCAKTNPPPSPPVNAPSKTKPPQRRAQVLARFRARVERQHPNWSRAKLAAEARRRADDFLDQGRAAPPPPRAAAVALKPRVAPPRARAKPSGGRSIPNSLDLATVHQLPTLQAVAPHVTSTIPGKSNGIVAGASNVRAYVTQTFSLAPGEELAAFTTPYSGGGGLWTSLSDSPNVPVSGASYSTHPGQQGGQYLAFNPTALPQADGSNFFNLEHWDKRAFGRDGLPSTTVFTQTATDGYCDSYTITQSTGNGGLGETYGQYLGGTLDFTVNTSYTSLSEVYAVGDATAPQVMGGVNNVDLTNRGNKADRAPYCANDALYEMAALTGDSIAGRLKPYVTPVISMGGSESSTLHGRIQLKARDGDGWFRMGCDQTGLPGGPASFLSPNNVKLKAAIIGTDYSPDQSGEIGLSPDGAWPPFCCGLEEGGTLGDFTTIPLNGGTNAVGFSTSQADSIVRATRCTTPAFLAQSANGLLIVRNIATDGVAVVTLTCEMVYAVHHAAGANSTFLVGQNSVVLPITVPSAPRSLGGGAGVAVTTALARHQAVDQSFMLSASLGQSIPRSIYSFAKRVADSDIVRGLGTRFVQTIGPRVSEVLNRAVDGLADRGISAIESLVPSIGSSAGSALESGVLALL